MSVVAASPPFASIVHHHLQLDDPDRLDLTSLERGLIVFWSDTRPVAQRWITPERSLARLSGVELVGSLGSLEPRRPNGQKKTDLSVSLVICTRDRADDLERCLRSIPLQRRRPDEVIVVDNASRGDATRAVALAAGVRYIREERGGLDIARNTGMLAAVSDLVAYTDDDTELHPMWLERLTQAFDSDEIVAVTGLVLPAALKTEAQWIFERRWGFGRGFKRIDFGPAFYRDTRLRGCPAWEVGAGANMAFRRSIADRVGLFDERLDVGAAGCSGDSEFWYRILAAGGACRYEPSAVLFHHHRLDMDGLAHQIRHYMRGHVAALMVQYERTGDIGNLVRALYILPMSYVKQLLGHFCRGRFRLDRLFVEELQGAAAGLTYYLKSRSA